MVEKPRSSRNHVDVSLSLSLEFHNMFQFRFAIFRLFSLRLKTSVEFSLALLLTHERVTHTRTPSRALTIFLRIISFSFVAHSLFSYVVVSHLVRNERLCQSPDTVWPFILYGRADSIPIFLPTEIEINRKSAKGQSGESCEVSEPRLPAVGDQMLNVGGKSRAKCANFIRRRRRRRRHRQWQCCRFSRTVAPPPKKGALKGGDTPPRRFCCCCFLLPLPSNIHMHSHSHVQGKCIWEYGGTVGTRYNRFIYYNTVIIVRENKEL